MRIGIGLGLLGAACIIACGSSSSKGGGGGVDVGGDSSGGANSVAGNAGKSSVPGGGKGNQGDAGDGNNGGGDAGEGGSGDLPPVVSTAKPHAAGGLVAGGTVGHSKHFTGVFSLGAAPGGNGLMTSKSHQLRGGVLGASQK